MNDITMPPAFPEREFRAFLAAANDFFPAPTTDEATFDPDEKTRHFHWSWQAVRYRYRACAESDDEFTSLLANAGQTWREGWGGDEELNYKLDRCIYMFFVSGLSVFDSFAFCLYFLGHAMRPGAFPNVTDRRNITRNATSNAFRAEFPQAAVTDLLARLPQDTGFTTIDEVRNRLAHRISGRRSVRVSSTAHLDGTHTQMREETWHIPGSNGILIFDHQLLQRPLDDITRLLTTLASAARQFAENH